MVFTHDILIIGAGCVGLTIASQLKKIAPNLSVGIVDKEEQVGLHTSGRNSGVIHSGIYYPPGSIKANVCIPGGKRLKEWVIEHKLPLNECGKLIIPQRSDLDPQIDLLKDRAIQNGASVEIVDSSQIAEICHVAQSASGRGLWSPNTCVVDPKSVLNKLYEQLVGQGVSFYLGSKHWKLRRDKNEIHINLADKLSYGHMFNCCGLNADKVAQKFDVGCEYKMIPFKGIYWSLKGEIAQQIKTNVYPVPDLNVPFLGVHFTPSAVDQESIYIGPTAVLALGRENYSGFQAMEPNETISNLNIILNEYIKNAGGFRKYVHEQAFLSFKPLMMRDAKQLIPAIKEVDITTSSKVGIRAQLFNMKTKSLENDFICVNGDSSTHVLNAVSPAFTASFSLADLIIKNSPLNLL